MRGRVAPGAGTEQEITKPKERERRPRPLTAAVDAGNRKYRRDEGGSRLPMMMPRDRRQCPRGHPGDCQEVCRVGSAEVGTAERSQYG